jgi:hypothetical protein
MTTQLRVVLTAAVVGLLGQVCAEAQTMKAATPAMRGPVHQQGPAAAGSGAIASQVRDVNGLPVPGAIVSAVGSRTLTATTDARGRCTLPALPAGEYLVRVHRAGFTVANSLIVRVTPGDVAAHSVVLRPIGVETESSGTVLAAGLTPAGTAGSTGPADDEDADHDHSETAWRLRHVKRSVLRDAVEQAGETAAAGDPAAIAGVAVVASTPPSPVHDSIFGASPFTGQINLLTTSTFDSPEQLLSDVNFARGIAYVSLGASAGQHGDWAMQAAMTQGDVASWVFAGSFVARPVAGHLYRAGLSYATQRYTGANPAAVSAVADGTRNSGTLYAYDTWTLTRRAVVLYGARYSRYGYIDGPLFSPRIELTVTPFDDYDKLRLRFEAAGRSEAPGADEFVASAIANTWVPPERTFAPLIGTTFTPERTHTYRVTMERDFTSSTLFAVRSFYQRTWDQTVTLFGVGSPRQNAVSSLDHYLVSNAGDFVARGWSVSLQQVIAHRLRGSIDYTITTARWQPSAQAAILDVFAPSAVRTGQERMQDVTTSLETEIPVTATRVFAMYRINTAYAAPAFTDAPPQLAARFDVQITQALPFLNFSSAQWEALVGVRNLFREFASDASVYDEVLVVRPPKRVVGGVTVRF